MIKATTFVLISVRLKHQRFRERLASTQEDVHEDVIADSMRWVMCLHVPFAIEASYKMLC